MNPLEQALADLIVVAQAQQREWDGEGDPAIVARVGDRLEALRREVLALARSESAAGRTRKRPELGEALLIVNGEKERWEYETITGREVRMIGCILGGTDLFLKVEDAPDRLIEDDDEIDLVHRNGGLARFSSQAKGSWAGAAERATATPPEDLKSLVLDYGYWAIRFGAAKGIDPANEGGYEQRTDEALEKLLQAIGAAGRTTATPLDVTQFLSARDLATIAAVVIPLTQNLGWTPEQRKRAASDLDHLGTRIAKLLAAANPSLQTPEEPTK